MAAYAPTLPAKLRERKTSNAIGEFEVPSYALRGVVLPPRMPADELGREIVVLLATHPEIESAYRGLDLSRMPQDEKIALLLTLKKSLGIKPIQTRRLGFVGID